jgi:hypothetical protein
VTRATSSRLFDRESNVEKDNVGEKEDREPDLVVIEEGSVEHKALQEREEDADEDDADHGEDGGDERLGKSETAEEDRQLYGRRRDNETDDQYRDRRRAERKQKKANRQAAISRNRTELRFLESRNEQLERQNMEMDRRLKDVEGVTAQTQAITVEGRIAHTEAQLAEAKTLMAAAVDASNGEDVVKCQEIISHLDGQIQQMKAYKAHLTKGGKTTPAKQESGTEERRQPGRVQPPKDPEIAKHSQSFQERLGWFDPKGRDPESATVYAIDTAMAGSGRFDPHTPKYWRELERRVRAALPHKFEDAEDDLDDADGDEPDERAEPAKGRGPRMPSGRQGGAKGGNTFYLSAERKQAMVEAGVYDDPKLRKKYITRYREWDQQNAGRK